MRDIKYAFRQMSRSPGFTAVAVAALALGIGANTAIFSLVNAVLLRPLPYPNADRLVVIWETNPNVGVMLDGPSGANFADWKAQSASFEEMAAIEPGSATITGLGEPLQIPGMRVTTNFLEMVGGRVVLGRDFQPNEGRKDNVVLLSHECWQERFGGDPKVIGRRVTADGLVYTVIGVVAPGLWSPLPADVLVARELEDLRGMQRTAHDLGVIARLKPGLEPSEAQAELNTIMSGIEGQHPEMKNWRVRVVPMKEALFGAVRLPLLVLLGAVGFVLLIACANVANLLLVKASARQREMAVRTALGADRRRLMGQLLMESVLLSGLGGAVGLLLAMWGIEALKALLPGSVSIPDANAEVLLTSVGIDAQVLAFTVVASLVTGILFGLAPAVAAGRTDVNEALKKTGRSMAVSQRGFRRLLVSGEVAVAVVLLIGAALMIVSFYNLRQVNPGFQAAGVLTMKMELPTDTKYRKRSEQAVFYAEVLRRVGTLPGVRAAAFSEVLPMDSATYETTSFLVEGRPPLPGGRRLPAELSEVSPDYFKTMGIPLIRGRVFTEHDRIDAPEVAVIDQSFARRYFPNEDPIGKVLLMRVPRKIVGVVGEIRHAGLDRAPQPSIYLSCLQNPDNLMTLFVKTAGNPASLAAAVKRAIYSVDPEQPVFQVRTMEEVVSGSQQMTRLTVVLLGAFGAIALLLAAMGIYGVMAYSAAQRTQEIGIRMALGASRGAVAGMVVVEGLWLAGAGLFVGLCAALLLTRVMSTLVYGVSTTNPAVFAIAPGVLLLVAVAASYLPARKAAGVDPISALRVE
jgi:putative ABC transport system permease protein